MAPREVARSRTTDSKRRRRGIALGVIPRSGAEATHRPIPCELECMENDYYRFLNHPRD